MKFKGKNTFLITVLAVAGLFGATSAVVSQKINTVPTPKMAEASTSVLNTSDGNLVYYQCNQSWNNSWTENGTRIFVYFYDDSSHSCWTSTWVNQDKFKYYYNSSDDSTAYFCYPSNTSYKWNHCIFVRESNTSTTGTFDNKWGQTVNIDLSNSMNVVKPLGNTGGWDSRTVDTWKDTGIAGKTISSGSTLYFEDYSTNSSEDAIIQAHFWGNIEQKDEQYVSMTKVLGTYADGVDTQTHPLFECTVPSTGGFVCCQFKRLNPSNPSTVWNTSGDYNFSSTNNVFKATSVIGGSFDWAISNATRETIFERYIVSQTAGRCTSSYYDVNTYLNFKDAWGNFKTQYENMSEACQYLFYEQAEDDSQYPGKGALRYDYILKKYETENYIEDFAGRRNTGGGYALGSAHIFNPFKPINEGENSLSTIIVAAGSVAILSVAALGFFVIKKRKNEE